MPMSNRVVIAGEGDPCPRCGVLMEIREHAAIRKIERRRPFYYTRWFYCRNAECKTTLVMPERYRVWNWGGKRRNRLETSMRNKRFNGDHVLVQRGVITETLAKQETGELIVWGDKWPEDELTA